MRPSSFFLKPAIRLPPPMKRVARMVPSTVWTVHTANCSPILRSTEQIFVSVFVICSAILDGEVKVFSMGVCSHHFCPRRTREGLPITYPSGRSRESVRTLIQLQHVPVQTLSMMDAPLRSAPSTFLRRRGRTCSMTEAGREDAL